MKASETNCETSLANKTSYLCAKCKDDGGYFVRKKKGEETLVRGFDGSFSTIVLKYDTDEWQECECAKVKKMNRLIQSSQITDKFRQCGFKNFITQDKPQVIADMRQLAVDYYRAFEAIRNTEQNSLLFSGQPGSGKTHLLMAIANTLMQKKLVPVAYFPYQDGMQEISANNFEKKNDIINKMCEVDMLFIDDLFKPIGGKVNVHPWQGSIIAEVTNYRYLHAKPMLISTEVSPLELLELFDEAAASRMIEMASDFTLTIEKNIMLNHRLRKVLS